MSGKIIGHVRWEMSGSITIREGDDYVDAITTGDSELLAEIFSTDEILDSMEDEDFFYLRLRTDTPPTSVMETQITVVDGADGLTPDMLRKRK